MRKTSRRHLEFESLESMVLLSGVSPMLAPSNLNASAVALSGVARGTYRSGPGFGAPIDFVAKGKLNPIGRSTLIGSVQLATATPNGTIEISNGRGQLSASLDTQVLGSRVHYTVLSGTGVLAGAVGTSGFATVSVLPARGAGPAHGRLTIRF